MYVNDEEFINFISDTFGSNYGYIYYDLTEKLIRPAKILGVSSTALVKTANGLVRHILQEQSTADALHVSPDFTDGESGVRFRILFMREKNEPAGALLVIDNVERKRQLLAELGKYLQADLLQKPDAEQDFEKEEAIQSLSELSGLVNFLIGRLGRRDAADLDPNAKMKIVRELKKRGVFKFKGAIGMTAPLLNISTPTVYRYLSQMDEHQPAAGGMTPTENIRLI